MKAGEVLFIFGLLITCGVGSPEVAPSSVAQIVAVAAFGLCITALGARLMLNPPRKTYFHERL